MAINVLTPIETRYKGILFRSRIEARWALFYDKIKEPWEYEREGYKLDASTYYLPDFWMPRLDCFIEIKGAPPNFEEEAKASILAQQSGKDAFLFFGGIPTIEQYGFINFDPEKAAWRYKPDGTFEGGYLWCIHEHHAEDKQTIHIASAEFHLLIKSIGAHGMNPAHDRLVYAYDAARSARFGT